MTRLTIRTGDKITTKDGTIKIIKVLDGCTARAQMEYNDGIKDPAFYLNDYTLARYLNRVNGGDHVVTFKR